MKSKMIERKYTKIYFRIFPMEKMIWDHVKILDDHKTVYIRCLQELSKHKENVTPTFWTFKSEQVFYNNTQREVYDSVIKDVLENLSQGHDAIIMAYGQTGTGKTLTMSGLHHSYEDRGILPRVIPDLFEMKKTLTGSRNEIKMCIQVSFVEMSRSTVFDLLKPYPNILHSLKDISKVKVKSADDALKLIFRGEGRKQCNENPTYPSHSYNSICTFIITTKNTGMQDCQLNQCKLHVIDLAGVDTIGNFTCFFKNPQDVGGANLAKTQLEQFFLVLSEDIPEYIKIKYRVNPLIQYLGTSLSNYSILRFIGHIRVSRDDLMITISMLRFGELIGDLKATKYEISIDNNISLKKMYNLQEELEKITAQDKHNSILMNQDLGKTLTEERFAHIQRTVNEYLQNKITELAVLNVCEAHTALEMLKMICKKYEEGKMKESSTIIKRRLSSAHKVHSRSSRGSNKTSSTDTAQKKNAEDKGNPTRSRSGLSTSMKSQDKIPSLHETSSKTRSKTSISSLLRRSLNGKRKSQSSTTNREGRLRSISNSILMPENIPPEYSEAWDLYINEKRQDYRNSLDIYQQNELGAKTAYKSYLKEVGILKQMVAQIDKMKNDLLMGKMTRELQNIKKQDNNGELIVSEFEKCCSEELIKAEKEQMEKSEIVLRLQAEMKTYMNVCKQVKKELKENFDLFCNEKYQMPLVENLIDDVTTMNIEDMFEAEQRENRDVQNDIKTVEEDPDIKQFEQFKNLIAIEKKKKKLYQIKNREWLLY